MLAKMNEHHPSFLVCQHLARFLESRKLVPAGGQLPPPLGELRDLDVRRVRGELGAAEYERACDALRDPFVNALDHRGYFRLDAEDPASPRRAAVVIFLLALRGEFGEKAAKLQNLIRLVHAEPPAREGRLAEVLFIAPASTMDRKNVLEVFAGLARERAAKGPPEKEGALAPAHSLHFYHTFSLDVPRCQGVCPHEVVPAAEALKILAAERLGPRSLPQIKASDPVAVWIGAAPGQVVRVRPVSETTGEAVQYRLVVPG
jgi:DNA-directed RNA polymerase subunit H